MNDIDTQVYSLGKCEIDSPLKIPHFIEPDARVLLDVEYDKVLRSFKENNPLLTFENAGPRKKIFFDPEKTKAAIVTCGGLCPGLNNVIQGLVFTLYYEYGVKHIYGIKFGYEGLIPSYGHELMKLNPDEIDDIHMSGGTILGSSRGIQKFPDMVDTLVRNDISILFAIGGDGTLKGADLINEEIRKRNLNMVVVGIPKTIDNDINFVDKTFGFDTAVEAATEIIKGAHAEAKGARNGIGLVKLMGRDSGFIATHSTLTSNEVNFCLIPEVKFNLYGNNGFLKNLYNRLVKSRHAVIVVSEGAGQELFNSEKKTDASGNILHSDIGVFLKDEIIKYFKQENFHANLKYFDPSYYIRSKPASTSDAIFCLMLAQNAVHGAMAGKTGILIGRWNSYFTFAPIKATVKSRKKVDPDGYLWSMVKTATGQLDYI